MNINTKQTEWARRLARVLDRRKKGSLLDPNRRLTLLILGAMRALRVTR